MRKQGRGLQLNTGLKGTFPFLLSDGKKGYAQKE